MHKGHPCEMLYPEEYFGEGITNGANWYNVPGTSLCFDKDSLLDTESSVHLHLPYIKGI